MNTLLPLRFSLILIMFFSFQCLYGQNAISNQIDQNRNRIQNATSYAPLVEVDPSNFSIPTNVLSEQQIFELDQTTVQSIRNNSPEYLRISIPIEGRTTELQLFKAQIFGPDFRAELSSNPGVAVDIDRGAHYWGVVANESESLVAFSFYNKEITGSITIDGLQYTLGELQNSDYHVLYESQNLNHNFDFSCDAIPTTEQISTDLIPTQKSSVDDCVGIHIEVDYSFYQSAGSDVAAAENYITAVFAQMAILYANESISVYISFLHVWNTPSPFNQGTELDDLMNQSYGTANGDLVHLAHTMGGGGVAYLNVLCNNNDFNIGVSNFQGGYQNVPTYSWDVEVITHEIGHNLGSPHTHACAWNGNNTAIDGCGPASGNDEGCDPGLPVSGTIMSYCHLVGGVGIDFNLGFGQQPGDLIRNRVAAANCLQTCVATCDDGLQNGDETGIDCGGTDCPACPTCVDGIQNANETGIDCGGTDCPACPCAGGTGISLIMNTDNYVSETTWDFVDASGNVAASGGPYADGVKTIIETICLPPGCYDFTIYDSYGDGLFDGNTTGNYTVIDDSGNTLASGGGNFGSQEATNFCTTAGCANVDLDINFDGFPTQTSWDIQDASGNVMASGSGQNGSSATSESACLSDGCYTLNFYDALGNGMCPFRATASSGGTFITPGTLITAGATVATLGTVVTPGLCGNYTLRDANGTPLASGGGAFGAQQSNTFCLSGGTASIWQPDNGGAYARQQQSSTGLEVFPTLASNDLFVYTSEMSEGQINIVNMNGQIIQQYQQNAPQMELNVSNLPAGIYFVQVVAGDTVLVEKFVKQ